MSFLREYGSSIALGAAVGLALVGILRVAPAREPTFSEWDASGTRCIAAVIHRNVAIACDFPQRRARTRFKETPMPAFTATPEIHNDLSVPLEFEPLPPEKVEAAQRSRARLLGKRNAMDKQREAAAERGRIERAFQARPKDKPFADPLT